MVRGELIVARVAAGLSLSAIARLAGCCAATVSAFERGRHDEPRKTASLMAVYSKLASAPAASAPDPEAAPGRHVEFQWLRRQVRAAARETAAESQDRSGRTFYLIEDVELLRLCRNVLLVSGARVIGD